MAVVDVEVVGPDPGSAPASVGATTSPPKRVAAPRVARTAILVIVDGQVVEQGTHATLLERGGVYARLHAASAVSAGSGHV